MLLLPQWSPISLFYTLLICTHLHDARILVQIILVLRAALEMKYATPQELLVQYYLVSLQESAC